VGALVLFLAAIKQLKELWK
jgi:hypothetical protein